VVITCPRCQKKYHLDSKSIEYSYSPDYGTEGVYWACHQCQHQWWQSKNDVLHQGHDEPRLSPPPHDHYRPINDENGGYADAFDVRIDLSALKKDMPLSPQANPSAPRQKPKSYGRVGQRTSGAHDHSLALHDEEPWRPALLSRGGVKDGLMDRHPSDPPKRLMPGMIGMPFGPSSDSSRTEGYNTKTPWHHRSEEDNEELEDDRSSAPPKKRSFAKAVIFLALMFASIGGAVMAFHYFIKDSAQPSTPYHGNRSSDQSKRPSRQSSSTPSKAHERLPQSPEDEPGDAMSPRKEHDEQERKKIGREERETFFRESANASSPVLPNNNSPKEQASGSHPLPSRGGGVSPKTSSSPTQNDSSPPMPPPDDEPFPPKDVEIDPKKVHYIESDGEGEKKNITVTGEVYNPNPFTVQLPNLQFVVWGKCPKSKKPDEKTGLCVVKKWKHHWSKKNIDGSGTTTFRTQNDVDKKEADGKIRVDVEID
jgi:hypothetical protein